MLRQRWCFDDVPRGSGVTMSRWRALVLGVGVMVALVAQGLPAHAYAVAPAIGTYGQVLAGTATEGLLFGASAPVAAVAGDATVIAGAAGVAATVGLATALVLLHGDAPPRSAGDYDADCKAMVDLNGGYPQWSSEFWSAPADSSGQPLCGVARMARLFTGDQVAHQPWQVRFCAYYLVWNHDSFGTDSWSTAACPSALRTRFFQSQQPVDPTLTAAPTGSVVKTGAALCAALHLYGGTGHADTCDSSGIHLSYANGSGGSNWAGYLDVPAGTVGMRAVLTINSLAWTMFTASPGGGCRINGDGPMMSAPGWGSYAVSFAGDMTCLSGAIYNGFNLSPVPSGQIGSWVGTSYIAINGDSSVCYPCTIGNTITEIDFETAGNVGPPAHQSAPIAPDPRTAYGLPVPTMVGAPSIPSDSPAPSTVTTIGTPTLTRTPDEATGPSTNNDFLHLGDRILSGLGNIARHIVGGVGDVLYRVGQVTQSILTWGFNQVTAAVHGVQSTVKWLGDIVTQVGAQIGDSIDWMRQQVVSAIGASADLIVSALNGLTGMIEEALQWAFVPDGTWLNAQATALQTQAATQFPASVITEVVSGGNSLVTTITSGLSGSPCGPALGFDGFTPPAGPTMPGFHVQMPSPSPCPGNGAGGSRTAQDDQAADLFGYRALVRGLMTFGVVWLSLWGIVGSASPWSRKSLESAPV